MKKRSLLFIAFILLMCLCACNKKEDKELSDQEILEEFASTLDIPEVITEDLSLQRSYQYKDKTINLTYQSSDTRIISNEGKYYLSLDDCFVSLDVNLTLNDATYSKTFDIEVKKSSIDSLLDKAYFELNIPENTYGNLELVSTLKYGKVTLSVSYQSNDTNIMNNKGEIVLSKEDKTVNFSTTLKYISKNVEKTFNKNILVYGINQNKVFELIKQLDYGKEYEEDIVLADSIIYDGIKLNLTYSSSNENVLSNDGKINPSNTKTVVEFTVSAMDISYSFNVSVMPMSDELCITKALDEVVITSKITCNIILPTTYSYGVSAKWESSNQELLSNDGILANNISSYTNINLKVTLSKGEINSSKEFKCVVGNESHMYLDKTFDGTLTNLEIVNGKMVLSATATSGTYISKEINVNNFTECIASYAATSSKEATCELSIRVKSNNTWSKYFSYGEWGQGLKNLSVNQNDTYFKMDTDEILAIGSNYANAFQLKLVVKRKSTEVSSPIVSLIACSLKYSSYTYNVNISNLDKDVKYDVPRLYQGAVPGIGGSICSATTSTMLLKYKGHNFVGLADYEHEYIAYIVKDYGHDIFGNWVYNTIGIGSYGELSYVKRFYSLDELIYHLANVGPVGCSVKGYVVNGVKNYNTNGHLIVVTGYRINNDGSKVLYINDPNVPTVSVEMTEENFMNINRNVYYVVE